MALRTEAAVRISRMASERAWSESAARADRRAISIQMGCPEGESAEWGRDMPRASPTTWLVAAVPRNWQPPPGGAQGREPTPAGDPHVVDRESTRPKTKPLRH